MELAVVVVVVVGAAWAVGAVLDGGQTDGEALSSEIVAAGLGLGSCLCSPEASEKHKENKLFAGAVGWGGPSLPREEALGPVLGAVGQLDPHHPNGGALPVPLFSSWKLRDATASQLLAGCIVEKAILPWQSMRCSSSSLPSP